jgi:hypothetical protein
MTIQISPAILADEVRGIYKPDDAGSASLIEAYLEERLRGFSPDERLALLENLVAQFDKGALGKSGGRNLEEEVLSRLFSLLLGRKVSQADLSSAELLERLALSLNTIFDTLNQLVSVINATLLGERIGEETIRHVIGFHLEGESQSQSLESYIGQITKAFLITQQAFKETAHAKVSEILLELDPDRIAQAGGGGFKFGPLRKAEFFEIYEEKFRTFKKWFESGRFMEEFLREFEKNSQKLSVE